MKPAIKRTAAAKEVAYAHGGGGYSFRQATLAEGALAESSGPSEATPSAGKLCHKQRHMSACLNCSTAPQLKFCCHAIRFCLGCTASRSVLAVGELCSSQSHFTSISLHAIGYICGRVCERGASEKLQRQHSPPLHNVRTLQDIRTPFETCCCA